MTVHEGELETGQHFDRFRVGRPIGGGRTGTVHEALDTVRQRKVAIRVLRPDVEADTEVRDRLVGVARVQRRLESEHVVRVLELGETHGRSWVVTELVADGNLGVVLDAKGAPPLPVAVDCVAQVAAGLADAHAVGLRHGDLGAGDVLLEQRRDDSLRATVTGFGSRQDDRLVEPAEDLRGLGVLLWATVSGDPTYDGILPADGRAPQVPPESAMAVEVNRILRRTLTPADGEEYRTAAELHRDLAAVARAPEDPVPTDAASAGTPTPGAPRPPVRTPADPETSRQVLLATVIALVLVIGAMVVAALAVG